MEERSEKKREGENETAKCRAKKRRLKGPPITRPDHLIIRGHCALSGGGNLNAVPFEDS